MGQNDYTGKLLPRIFNIFHFVQFVNFAPGFPSDNGRDALLDTRAGRRTLQQRREEAANTAEGLV